MRGWGRFALIATGLTVITLASLWGAAQAALWSVDQGGAFPVLQSLGANYGVWQFLPVPPISTEIVTDIAAEVAEESTLTPLAASPTVKPPLVFGPTVTERPLPSRTTQATTTTAPAQPGATAQPTATALPPAATETRQPTVPPATATRTRVVTRTATRTPVFPTPTTTPS